MTPAMPRLSHDFYARDPLAVAHDLLGCILVRQVDALQLAGRIVEVEAYSGWDDLASHGHRGLTPRNAVMFGPAGITYVYLCYGVHWMLNVVARPPDVDWPGAILIRAIEPLEGLQSMENRRAGRQRRDWTNGPGRLTRAFGITSAQHGLDLTDRASRLFIEPGAPLAGEWVMRGPRVGIRVPEPSRSWPWRLWIKDNPFVSRAR